MMGLDHAHSVHDCRVYDAMLSVLEDHSDDPVRTELFAIIRGLNEDEQIDLVALAWRCYETVFDLDQ